MNISPAHTRRRVGRACALSIEDDVFIRHIRSRVHSRRAHRVHAYLVSAGSSGEQRYYDINANFLVGAGIIRISSPSIGIARAHVSSVYCMTFRRGGDVNKPLSVRSPHRTERGGDRYLFAGHREVRVTGGFSIPEIAGRACTVERATHRDS